jgi:hypothetical protein
MTDNIKRKRPEDPTKINVNQTWEVKYWCNEFGVTEDELKSAVELVGVYVKDVRKYLGK